MDQGQGRSKGSGQGMSEDREGARAGNELGQGRSRARAWEGQGHWHQRPIQSLKVLLMAGFSLHHRGSQHPIQTTAKIERGARQGLSD